MVRRLFVLLHRYAGLTMAIFLTIAGLTGSILAFRNELDAWLNPELFQTKSRGEPLSTTNLVARVEEKDPRIRVILAPLRIEPGSAAALLVQPRADPVTGKAFSLDYNQVFADPVTGATLGARYSGACCFQRQNLIPFLYLVHYSLFAGRWGKYLMGGIAVLWVLDCFVGFYLTLPARRRRRDFWRRWKPAWWVKTSGTTYRVNFDLHRASGLWFWLILLVLAVSSVALNLNEEVFRPAVSLFSKLTPHPFERFQSRKTPAGSVQSFNDAVARATEEVAKHDWNLAPANVLYISTLGIYGVIFSRSGANNAGPNSLTIYIDDQDGQVRASYSPDWGTAGDAFVSLQLPLHSGQIMGLPGRIVISITGLVVATVCITGVLIWWKKRAA